MRPATFNTPLGEQGLRGHEQLFKNIDEKVDVFELLESAQDLTRKAAGLAGVLSVCDNGGGFVANHESMVGGIDSLHSLLEQLEAVLHHPTKQQRGI